MAAKGLIFTGARARLSINGVKVGFARNCSGREMIQYERVKVLDNIQTQEHVPVDYDVSFTAGMVRIVGETVKSLGYFPSLGSNPAEHLTNILTNGSLTITIEDNQTGAIVMTLEQAKCQTNNFSLDASGVVGQDLEFVAIRSRDESEV